MNEATGQSAKSSSKATPAELKAELRRTLRAQSRRASPAQRAAASTQICQRLQDQPIWRRAAIILFYFPMEGEPDISPLLLETLTAEKTVCLPRYSSQNGNYEACQIRDPGSELMPGSFGIHEPGVRCPTVDLKKLDLLLVPGLGFALNGLRLGRGKGFYDRLLAQTCGYKCGVAFDWQVVVEIPVEPHDICLDCILTPTDWHVAASQRRL